MKNTAIKPDQNIQNSLAQARALELPSREAMLKRSLSVQQFWDNNKALLADAWKEWDEAERLQAFVPNDALLDSKLREAVTVAWNDPTKEHAVEDLWQEISPGVYQAQFFDPKRLIEFREYLDEIANAQIPMRPPYGIALNRYGAMLDPRSEGYLAAPSFQTFYREIMDKYMRPISRLLFPEVMGFDTQTFGFSIQYEPGIDTSLRAHTDASSATLNVNLNLPDESFEGSEVDFYDPKTGQANRLSFEPGTAMLHRGKIAHAAQPITAGKRTNFVFWLYGDFMQIPGEYDQPKMIDAKERWTIPITKHDAIAPF